MKTLNADQALDLLRRAVSEKGAGYVYSDEHSLCQYVIYGKPACIVGHVYHYLGIANEDITEGISTGSLSEMKQRGVLDATVGAALVLAAAQGAQDTGSTWGQALHAALRVYNTLRISGIGDEPFSSGNRPWQPTM